MLIPTVTQGVKPISAEVTVSVYGRGAFGDAVIAWLRNAGNQVISLVPREDFANAGDDNFAVPQAASDQRQITSSGHVVILAVPATEYGAATKYLSRALLGGESIFIVGAPVGAALELGKLFSEYNCDRSLNIVEVGRPFAFYRLTGESVEIADLRQTLCMAGRSLNETRAGLSAASAIFSNLVPASTLLERAFADMDHWLAAAASLLNSLGPGDRSQPTRAGQFNPNSGVVMRALADELKLLASAYGIKCGAAITSPTPATTNNQDCLQSIKQVVSEDFVILSSLARQAHVQVPLIEAIIELASVVTSENLRASARQLTHLGLLGMDCREIVEFLS